MNNGCCFLRNIQDFMSERKTQHERRFGELVSGPITPFGAQVECHPISKKDSATFQQFGKKVLSGIFYGLRWKGDILPADVEELQQNDASEV